LEIHQIIRPPRIKVPSNSQWRAITSHRPQQIPNGTGQKQATGKSIRNEKRRSDIQPAGHPILAVLQKVDETTNLNPHSRLKAARSRQALIPNP
jgi:hypothetical protein